jgi:alginate O-acetyltransferase complex protein AlgJ
MRRRLAALWLVLVGVLLSAPLVIAIVAPQAGSVLEDEMRARATLPGFPFSLRQWRALPGKIDAYFRDHFGMRKELIHIHALLSHRILKTSNALVQIGDHDWLFLRSDKMLQQSAGLLIREQQVIETADTIAHVRDVLASKGVRLIFASPPNSATIYADLLPEWARNQGRRTEYDLMLDALANRDVETVDLRLPLRAAREYGAVYFQHDTHWSARGAVLGFNAVAAAMGHNNWQFNPSVVLGPAVRREGGDLARMLDIAEDVAEWTEPLQLPSAPTKVSDRPHIVTVGDSFTGGFAPFLVANGAGFTWIHHEWCGFDWNEIEAVHPDEVWWMPTERYMLCNNVRPKGMPTIDDSVVKKSVALVAH